MKLFLQLFILASGLKTLKFSGKHVYRHLNLKEWHHLFLLVLFILSLQNWSEQQTFSSIVNIGFCLGQCLFFSFIWLDALLYQKYAISLDWPSTQLFIKNRTYFNAEQNELGKFAWTHHFFSFLLCIFFVGLSFWFQLNNFILALGEAFFWTISLLLLTKTRQHRFLIQVSLFVLLMIIFYGGASFFPTTVGSVRTVITGLVIVDVLIFTTWYFLSSRYFHPLLQRSSIFNLLKLDLQKKSVDTSLNILNQDLAIVASEPILQNPDFKSNLKKPHVIMITIESLSRQAFESMVPSPALWREWSPQSLVSQGHYCVSPNTNSAFEFLYYGQYTSNEPVHFLPQLKNQGYKSILMCSQETEAFGFASLAKNIGFDECWGPSQLAGPGFTKNVHKGSISDDCFLNHGWQMLQQEFESHSGPLLIHLLNSQTHVPYTSYTKKADGLLQPQSNWQKYLAAINETAEIVQEWLSRLKKMGILDNAVLIICGDHGQSFGQWGYEVHSNSTVSDQLDVPFLLWHPQISPQTIKRSSHLDVLPTLWQLLGLNVAGGVLPKFYGVNLFASEPDYDQNPLVVFSQTRYGQWPSNFGVIRNQEQIMIDLILERYWKWQFPNNQPQNLSPQEQKYWLSCLLQGLTVRGCKKIV